jgi:hypothetical protein
MSSIKNPKEKKLLSLKNDRRNVYGENPASSRKNIARGKQRSHQQERHAISEVLLGQSGSSVDLDGDEVESAVRDKAVISKRKAFKKWPDAPLADVLYRRKTGTYPNAGGNNVKQSTLDTLRKKR